MSKVKKIEKASFAKQVGMGSHRMKKQLSMTTLLKLMRKVKNQIGFIMY